MSLNSHISAYARCLAEKVCGVVRSTWGTSQGEDKLGANIPPMSPQGSPNETPMTPLGVCGALLGGYWGVNRGSLGGAWAGLRLKGASYPPPIPFWEDCPSRPKPLLSSPPMPSNRFATAGTATEPALQPQPLVQPLSNPSSLPAPRVLLNNSASLGGGWGGV